MRIYLSNKMTGIPYFNAPWFDAATLELMSLPDVEEVFNPAEHDRENGFEPMDVPTGTIEEAVKHGFVLGPALLGDWTYIANEADAVIVGPRWMDSKGAISEVACAQALGKPVYEYQVFRAFHGSPSLQQFKLPPIMELGGMPATLGWEPDRSRS